MRWWWWDHGVITLIRRCIWSQNFQCFRNVENSLGCQTELNKLIYRPNRYIYIYSLLACKASGEIVTKLAKIYGRKWADGHRSPAIDGAVQCQAERARMRVPKLISKPTYHLLSFFPRLLWHYNSQFSLYLCRYWASCLGACKLVFVSGQRRMWHPFASIRQRGL